MSDSSNTQPLEELPTRLSPRPHAATFGAPSEETVSIDWPCRHCGYNLRTLPILGICPECGRSVRKTVDNLLVRADPAWLYTVRLGASVLAWVPSMVGAACIASGLIGVAAGPQVLVLALVAFVAILAAGVAWGVGLFALAKPEPPKGTAVNLPQASAVFVIGAFAIGSALVLHDIWLGLALMWAGAWVPLIVGPSIIRRLARRDGDERVEKHALNTLQIAVTSVVSTLLALALRLALPLFPIPFDCVPSIAMFVCMGLSILTHFAGFVYGVWLMFRAARMLSGVIEIAEKLRASDAPSVGETDSPER